MLKAGQQCQKIVGPIEAAIVQKLNAEFAPARLVVENESWKHSVPKGSETHFRVVVVSDLFAGKGLLQRHRMINKLLAVELSGGKENGIHALAIVAKTIAEWDSQPVAGTSPACLGGSKEDR